MTPSRSRLRLDRSFIPALAALAFVLVWFEVSDTDIRLQDHLFDFPHGRWIVDGADPLWRVLFYTGPKAALVVFGLVAIARLLAPVQWAWIRRAFGGTSPADVGVIVLTLATTPVLIGWGKSVTNVFCPSEIRRYGGDVPYVKVFSSYPPGDRPARVGRGFPAGHASGGFALLALAGLARTRRGQLAGMAVGLVVGGAMGGYQMMKGSHYLSHTLVTGLVAWLVFIAWRLVFRRRDRDDANPLAASRTAAGPAGESTAMESRSVRNSDCASSLPRFGRCETPVAACDDFGNLVPSEATSANRSSRI